MVQKIMERDSAIKLLDEIKNKICGIDLDELCGDKVEVKEEKENDAIYNRLLQGVQCGLVYYDDEKQCLVQELLRPVKSGEVELKTLYYKHKLTLGDGKQFKAKNAAGLIIESIATACSRPTQVIEKIGGQDIQIAQGCMSFFDK